MRIDLKSPTDEEGIALFVVLWVLVLLSVIVGEFCHAMRTEMNVTRNYKEQRQAYYIALAGFNRAVLELVRQDRMGGKPVIGEEGVALLRSVFGTPVHDKEGIVPEKPEWRINTEIPPEPFGSGEFQVRLGNESGKVNLNLADESALRMLLDTFALDQREKDIIVDSILDWRDADDLHRINGAEDEYYKSLKAPYECKDGDFDTVEELLLVRGVTDDLFYGGLREMVTVLGGGRSAGKKARQAVQQAQVVADQKINVNAASPRMLRALPGMTDEAVEGILAFRKEADIMTLDDLISAVGADAAAMIQPFVTFQPGPYYTVQVVGRVEGAPVQQGVEVLIELERGRKTGYRILQWRDRLRPASLNGS